MAETYQAGPETEPEKDTSKRQSGFHYYSGGQIKELAHTKVSPLLWAGWTVVIIGAVLYLFFGGALGPNSPLGGGGFKPDSGSTKALNGIQASLDQQMYGKETAQMADMRQLTPFLGGESLTMAVQHGSNTYQNYCIGCHGPNQDGNGVNASSLNPKPRNLHDAPFMRETMNYQRINTSLHYGVHGTAMPRWENTLTEHEIQEVLSYVLSLTWTMPPSSDMDTTTGQLNSPHPGPGKSATGSVTGTAGGSFVHDAGNGGASISNSPAPITPTVEGNPAAETSTAPPSQSGQGAPVAPSGLNSNTPDAGSGTGGPPSPPSPHATSPAGSQPGYLMPGGQR